MRRASSASSSPRDAADEQRLPTNDRCPGSALLKVVDLKKYFPVERGVVFRRTVDQVRAVDGVSFVVHEGETLGLVGESACGKSTLARTMLRLEEPTAGEIHLENRDIRAMSGDDLRRMRRDLQIVFQDPFGSLNPKLRIGTIIREPARSHDMELSEDDLATLLERVGLNSADARRYPHELSGGQRQRIAIARALVTNPKLLVCDEPTSSLDVSIQAQILNLLATLQDDCGMSYLIISHDLSVVRDVAHSVAVMYSGRIVEFAPAEDLFAAPLHPYTVALLSAVPVPDPDLEDRRRRITLAGQVSAATSRPPGCPFHTRCWKAEEVCRVEEPPLLEIRPGHWVSCHFPTQGDRPFDDVNPPGQSVGPRRRAHHRQGD